MQPQNQNTKNSTDYHSSNNGKGKPKPSRTSVRIFIHELFHQLSSGCLMPDEYSFSEDQKRAEIVGVSNKKLSQHLTGSALPTTLASFRRWQEYATKTVPGLASQMSKYNDLVFVTITPRDGGIPYSDCNADSLCDAIDQLYVFVEDTLKEIGSKKHPTFGCIELSSFGSKIQPHAHILCRKATLKLLKTASRKLGKRYNVKPDPMNAHEAIPSQCVTQIHYILKGTTWTKEEASGKKGRPTKNVERLILKTLDQLKFDEVIISHDLNLTDNFRAETRQKTSNPKQGISDEGSQRQGSEGNSGQKDKSGEKQDRIGSVKWHDLSELTRQQTLKHVNSLKAGWTSLTSSNSTFDAAFMGRSGSDSFYAIKTAGNEPEIICLNDNSNPDLAAQIGQAGIQINTNKSLENFKSQLESLENLKLPIVTERAGLIEERDAQGNSSFAYALNSREYCGAPPKGLYTIKDASVSSHHSSVSGNAAIWAAEIAPLIRGMPIPIAVLGYGLCTPLRSITQVAEKQIDQSSLILCGAGSRGKTTIASSLVQGLYGPTDKIETFNATVNALNQRLTEYHGRCAVADDLSKLDVGTNPSETRQRELRLQALAELIMRIDDGKDKARFGTSADHIATFGCAVTSNDTPGDFSMIGVEKRDAVLARSIQLEFRATENALNTMGIEPELAVETLRNVAQRNHGWIGLQFSSALCRHLNNDFQRTVDNIITDYEKFLDNAKKRHPSTSSIGNRIMKQFALMYATLKFASRAEVLPISIWGSPSRPLCVAMEMALTTARLVDDNAGGGDENTSPTTKRRKWNITEIHTQISKRSMTYPHRFIDARKGKFQQLDNSIASKSIFVISRRKEGTCIAIKKRPFLEKVFPAIDEKELTILRASGDLVTTDRTGFSITLPLRKKRGSKNQKAEPERCFCFRLNPKQVAELDEMFQKAQSTNH